MVIVYMSKCVENLAIVKMIRQFPNQKPWVDRKVRALVMERNIR